MAGVEEPPVPLPTAQVKHLECGITLRSPLSRRGHGLGLLLITPDSLPSSVSDRELEEKGTPPPLLKWAEESYAVVQIPTSTLNHHSDPRRLLELALAALQSQEQCDQEGGIGLVCYDWRAWKILTRIDFINNFTACVIYGSAEELPSASTRPALFHVPGKATGPARKEASLTIYHYDDVSSALFAVPGQIEFDYRSESISHTRNLSFLKSHMNGPYFDLEAIWEEHTYYEFENRSVAKTMGTMVQEPYVNHIPTLTGGIGRKSLTNFYRDHFIWSNPDDTYNRMVSRTIGVDRICDEFIMELTHNRAVDWLLPGIPPTGKKLRIPFSATVNIRGDRLYHEHITWDHASCLAQCGLLPEYLPFPYPLPDGRLPGKGKQFEYRLPVAGVETAVKMLDKHELPSNTMMEYKIREVGLH